MKESGRRVNHSSAIVWAVGKESLIEAKSRVKSTAGERTFGLSVRRK